MGWIRSCTKLHKDVAKRYILCDSTIYNRQDLGNGKLQCFSLLRHRGFTELSTFKKATSGIWRFSRIYSQNYGISVFHSHGLSTGNRPKLDRDFFAKLWAADEKMRSSTLKRRKKVEYVNNGAQDSGDVFKFLVEKWSSVRSTTAEKSVKSVDPTKLELEQPPPSQSVTGALKPTSPEEVQIAPLLARSNLLVTRDIEWANLVLGFEQENRYAIVDVCYPQSPAGFIREQSHVIARQLLRTRRPFVAYITDALGVELFRVRRPFWWINSSIFVEINEKEVGVVHRQWHLWKRIYDLYLGNKQFAVVENPGFWNWTFTLKDIDGKMLAQIDRDWRGFGFEIFTDAGQYVVRFGKTDFKVADVRGIPELEAVRPLTLSERAVTLALAVSLDNDYFSRHGGWAIPFIAVEE